MKLGIGDKFPEVTLTLTNGLTLNIPEDVNSDYNIVLFYRGHW